MSRSGYSEDAWDDQWRMIRWRGAVASAIKGKRGQAFLREALAALDALPEHKLIQNNLAAEGSFCTLGAVGHKRGANMSGVDTENHEAVAELFAVPHALACEIMWENDDGCWGGNETPEQRWARMRAWITSNLKTNTVTP